jgi:hypothetical protein
VSSPTAKRCAVLAPYLVPGVDRVVRRKELAHLVLRSKRLASLGHRRSRRTGARHRWPVDDPATAGVRQRSSDHTGARPGRQHRLLLRRTTTPHLVVRLRVDDVRPALGTVVGTTVITRHLPVSFSCCVATGQTRCATSDVPLSRVASANKEVGRIPLRATLIVAAIAMAALAMAGLTPHAEADPAPPAPACVTPDGAPCAPVPQGCVQPDNSLPCSSSLPDINAAIRKELQGILGGVGGGR